MSRQQFDQKTKRPLSNRTLNWLLAGALLLLLLPFAWDGWLARRWSVVSKLGKMSDPLMDKIFYLVAFPALTWQIARQGESEAHALVMLGFTVLYMLRDTWVTFLRSVGAMYGADVAAMWRGKVRAALCELVIDGIPTNISEQLGIIGDERFVSGRYDLTFMGNR